MQCKVAKSTHDRQTWSVQILQKRDDNVVNHPYETYKRKKFISINFAMQKRFLLPVWQIISSPFAKQSSHSTL